MAIDIIARGMAGSGGGGGSSDISYIRIQGELNDLPIVGKRVTLPLATDEEAGLIKLSHLPVGELDGTTTPINISSLDSGVYKISGEYVLKSGMTPSQSSPDYLFYVDKDGTVTNVTVQGSTEAIIYNIPTSGDVEEDRYLTYNDWVGSF